MLSADRLRVKASAAIQGAVLEARQRGNPEIHGVHLLDVLFGQEEGIVGFRPLGTPELTRIVKLQLERVSELTTDLGIVLEVTPAAQLYLAEEGYESAYGARPLKRSIQRSIQDPLALYLLEEEVLEGIKVLVDVAKDCTGLDFEAVPPNALADSPTSVG